HLKAIALEEQIQNNQRCRPAKRPGRGAGLLGNRAGRTRAAAATGNHRRGRQAKKEFVPTAVNRDGTSEYRQRQKHQCRTAREQTTKHISSGMYDLSWAWMGL